MSGIDDIPAETRWAVATQAMTGALTATGAAFEQAVGVEGYRRISAAIWGEAGKSSGGLAEAMGLPRPTDIPSLWNVTETLLQLTMGPESMVEIVDMTPDRLEAHVTACPWANRAREQGVPQTDVCVAGDHAWCVGLADYFGLKIKHEITTAMPLGDQYCTAVYQMEA